MSDRQLFKTLTQAVPGLVWICDEQGQVEFNNPQWTAFTGMPQDQALGHGWLAAIHPADVSAFRASLPLVPLTSDDVQAEISVRRHDGAYHRHIVTIRHVGNRKWIGCAIDAHEWLTTALRDATQGQILEMIAQGVCLNDVLVELCRAAEKQIPGATCSILLVDAATGKFTSGVAPGLPEGLFDAVDQIRIGTGVGSCGTAAFEERDVISEDILADPNWEGWRDLVVPLGYRACWSKPVFASDGKVIASFGFYFRQPRKPKPNEYHELSRLRELAALAIERAHVLAALRESEEHYRHTVEQNPQVTWTASRSGDILSASSRWTELTGNPLGEGLGSGWLKTLHPDDVEHTIERWELALATGNALDVTYRFRMKDGEFRWCRGRATARRDNDGRVVRWYGTVEDVHEQHLAAEKLKRQAYQDDLTGLPNRRAFVEALRTRLGKTQEPIGLMVLDMDDFKIVNDRFGHLAGDALLRLFGRYLQAVAQPTEYVARLGGDEFAFICGNTAGETDLRKRAREIETFLDKRLKANKKSRGSRASIGCTLGKSGENPDEVFKRADLALYAAKQSGKGKFQLDTRKNPGLLSDFMIHFGEPLGVPIWIRSRCSV